MGIKQRLDTVIQKIVDAVSGSGVMQEESTADGAKKIFDPMPPVAQKSAEESIVLLKNNNGTLPIKDGETVSIFGRCQIDYFYVGYGSGGDVNAPYQVNLIDGLKNNNVNIYLPLLNLYEGW
ncbi:MAG: glycoside hydrolase family 3 C-terminal domain-containing protein, partial [Eubacterium sp.]